MVGGWMVTCLSQPCQPCLTTPAIAPTPATPVCLSPPHASHTPASPLANTTHLPHLSHIYLPIHTCLSSYPHTCLPTTPLSKLSTNTHTHIYILTSQPLHIPDYPLLYYIPVSIYIHVSEWCQCWIYDKSAVVNTSANYKVIN